MNSVHPILPQAFSLSETIACINRAETSFDVFKQLKQTGASFRLEHFLVARQASNFAQRVIITNWDAELLARFIEEKMADRSVIVRELRDLTNPAAISLAGSIAREEPAVRGEMKHLVDQGYDRMAYFPIQYDNKTKGSVSFTGMREPVEAEEMAQMFLVARHALTRLIEVSPSGTPQNPLTQREIEVFELVADGLTADELGSRLEISGHTVNYHICNATRKVGAKNKTQALVTMIQSGWLSRDL